MGHTDRRTPFAASVAALPSPGLALARSKPGVTATWLTDDTQAAGAGAVAALKGRQRPWFGNSVEGVRL
jgi:hypothetical protein